MRNGKGILLSDKIVVIQTVFDAVFILCPQWRQQRQAILTEKIRLDLGKKAQGIDLVLVFDVKLQQGSVRCWCQAFEPAIFQQDVDALLGENESVTKRQNLYRFAIFAGKAGPALLSLPSQTHKS